MVRNKEFKIETLKEAMEILNRFEYSSDGFVNVYPEQHEYDAALNFLKEFHKYN